jgi:hypothetical protein
MARLFWKRGSNAVCSALVAKTIFLSYSKFFGESLLKFESLAKYKV